MWIPTACSQSRPAEEQTAAAQRSKEDRVRMGSQGSGSGEVFRPAGGSGMIHPCSQGCSLASTAASAQPRPTMMGTWTVTGKGWGAAGGGGGQVHPVTPGPQDLW